MATGDRPAESWMAVLRRQPARVAGARPVGSYTDMFEIICCDCGVDPRLDYSEVLPRHQLVRGLYTLAAGIAAYEQQLRNAPAADGAGSWGRWAIMAGRR